MSDHEIPQSLGRIEGKVDQMLSAMNRHIDDDVRRFSDVYQKLGEQSADINKAKGAKSVVLWLVGGGAAAIGGVIAMAAKALGVK